MKDQTQASTAEEGRENFFHSSIDNELGSARLVGSCAARPTTPAQAPGPRPVQSVLYRPSFLSPPFLPDLIHSARSGAGQKRESGEGPDGGGDSGSHQVAGGYASR
jgi:hypothetical protein